MGDSQKKGLVCWLETVDERTVRFVLDDVIGSEATWVKTVLYTERLIALSKVENLEFSTEELADIGAVVLARLVAFRGPISAKEDEPSD